MMRFCDRNPVTMDSTGPNTAPNTVATPRSAPSSAPPSTPATPAKPCHSGARNVPTAEKIPGRAWNAPVMALPAAANAPEAPPIMGLIMSANANATLSLVRAHTAESVCALCSAAASIRRNVSPPPAWIAAITVSIDTLPWVT